MSPLVSVIIPTYNRSYCIKKAIESVLSQTFKDFELIIIDNYSNDDTEEIINNYKNKKIIYEKFHNYGVIASSRNRGIALSNSKYVAFLDSDDWWKKDKLKVSIDCLENGKKQLIDGLEGRKSLELINAIYESIETNLPVNLGSKYIHSKLGKLKKNGN